MAYFDRLQKRARYYDSDAGEYRWSGWKYTGSSAAGADYVSESGLCVVYGANVRYAAGESGLSGLDISTNFVSPLSTGNPSQACCYLYLSDPTLNGDVSVASPPPGAYAIAAAIDFEADVAGDHLSFTFSGLDIKPAQVFFWFTCSAQYESFGSNQIYHYATGNWSAALGTGTRTPTLTGSFIGGSGGGTGSGDGSGKYSVVACGSHSSIFAEKSFGVKLRELDAGYAVLSFSGGGDVDLSAAGEAEDSRLSISLYLSDSGSFDINSGRPTGNILAEYKNGGSSCYANGQVQVGKSYYLWCVIETAGFDENSLTLTVSPKSWNYTVADKGSYMELSQTERSFSMSMGSFQVGRMKLSFNYRAQIELTAKSGGEGDFISLWVSENEGIDSFSGRPVEYFCMLSDGERGWINVEKGKSYYVFGVYSGGSKAGSLSFNLKPPPVLWTLGASGTHSLIAASLSRSVSLASGKYGCLRLSFAHSGRASFYAEDLKLPAGQQAEAMLCQEDCFDVSQGSVDSYIAHAYSYSFGDYADMPFTAEVAAGRDYYLYIKNTLLTEGTDTSLSLKLCIDPPQAEQSYYLSTEKLAVSAAEDIKKENYISRYVMLRQSVSFRCRGQVTFKAATAEDSRGQPKLRAYVSEAGEADIRAGVPAGDIIASYTGKGDSFSLSFRAQEEKTYYLWTVTEEVYQALDALLTVEISCPPTRYFSVTDRGEYHALSEAVRHSSAPGESGVCLVELSFEKGGLIIVSSRESGGELRFLRGYVSLTPYLDGLSGRPWGSITAEGSGSENEPELSLVFYASPGETYCLFVRDDALYGDVSFTLDISRRDISAAIALSDGFHRSRCLIYSGERWHSAGAFVYQNGIWKGSR